MRLYLAEYLLYGIHEVRTHDTFRLSGQCAHTGAEGGGGIGRYGYDIIYNKV